MPVPGTLIEGKYEILAKIREGGMGAIYKVRHRLLDEIRVIKVMRPQIGEDEEMKKRFVQEAKTVTKLKHPNIGIVLDFALDSDGTSYIVMEFIDGVTLADILKTAGPPELPLALEITHQTLLALGYLHRRNVVHRDVAPDNLMLTRDEDGNPRVKVIDLGIAKALDKTVEITSTGVFLGKVKYCSPEQLGGLPKGEILDGRSDIYSLGVVAYQCLTGSVPYDGEDSFSIGYKHIMEEIPTPPLENPEKRQLFEVVKKMMAKTPAQRFQNADEVVSVLESGRSVSFTTDATMAMPSLSSARLPSAPTTPLPRATGGRPPGAAPERHSVVSGLLLWLLIVGTVFGGGGFYAYKKGLIFAKTPGGGGSDSTAARDTTARAHDSATVAGDATKGGGADSGGTATAPPPPISPGTPGRLVLQNVPPGARISVEGQPARGTQLDLTPGVHRLTVRAAGYQTYERQVIITAGETFSVRLDMQSSDDDSGPCDRFGPAYNQDNICFDRRPAPLSATLIPIPADATIFPRAVILLVHVSRDGETLEARVYATSNVETFNNDALEMAKRLRWNPAQKNGEPTDAWVQWPFQPVRQ